MFEVLKQEQRYGSWRTVFQSMRKSNRLSLSKQTEIQNAFKEELYLRIQLFNRKRSTAVSQKRYVILRRSMFYILDHALPYTQPETFLMDTPLQEQLCIGEAEIAKQIEAIRFLWTTCRSRPIIFLNERYHSVLNEQIPRFLETYNIPFESHICLEDLDYPLVYGLALDHDMYHKKGSDLVLTYLRYFDQEQRYLMHFQEELPQIIVRYEAMHGVSIAYLGANACQILMPLHLGKLLLPSLSNLEFNDAAIAYLSTRDIRRDKESLLHRLQFDLEQDVFEYLRKQWDNVIYNFEVAQKEQHLNRLLLFAHHEQERIFMLSKACEHSRFEQLLERLQNIDSLEQKITFLKDSNINTRDLIDVLENGIFYGQEYVTYFKHCSELEIALLLYIHKTEEFAFHVALNQMDIHNWIYDQEWQAIFYQYLLNLDATSWNSIITFLTTTRFIE